MKTSKKTKEAVVKDGRREVIWEDKPADFDQWFTMPVEQARIKYYGDKKRKDAHITTYYEDSEKVCVGCSHLTVAFNMYGALYPSRKSTWGFTFTKKTKRVKKWFGKPLNVNDAVFDYLIAKFPNMEFLKTDLPNFKHEVMQCSTTFGKVLSGKITNGRACVKEYLKVHGRGVKLSPEPVYNWAKGNAGIYRSTSIKHMIATARYLKNADILFMLPDAGTIVHGHTFRDTLKQARMLNRKIDLTWSPKRMSEVHKHWTREIMAEELKAIKEYNIFYKGELNNFPGFKLVSSQKDVFEIGVFEDHCVYSNYWSSIKSKRYFIIYGMYKDTYYTCGIDCKYKHRGAGMPELTDPKDIYEPFISQLQCKRNGGAPAELRAEIATWLTNPEVVAFFSENYKNILPEQSAQEYADINSSNRSNINFIDDF